MSVNVPSKMPVPFANAGLKNTIPPTTDNVNGLAGYSAGFGSINMTPKTAGGIPPFGQDFNGILFAITEGLRFFQAGSIYTYDSTFSTAVGGYRAGARVLRTDGTGYWLNLTDGNMTDPESAGAAAAGWVPDFTNGIASITMTNANVTLTPLQYGKPIISISGTLTANLNLIFPNIADNWIVINNTTGAFTITCKTAAGSGVTVPQSGNLQIVGDGTNILSLAPTVTSASVKSAYSNLAASATGSSATVTITADELVLENTSNNYQTVRSVSVTPSLAASGVNGLDTGTSVANTWYSAWVIWNGSSVAGLFSLSATSPTMPSGYTHKARVGWVRSDSTANKYPLGFTQKGRSVSYLVGSGNVTIPVQMATGVAGTFTTSAYSGVATAWAAYAPSTVASLLCGVTVAAASGLVGASANNSRSGFTSNNPPELMYFATNGPFAVETRIIPESANLYYAGTSANSILYIRGWEDNL